MTVYLSILPQCWSMTDDEQTFFNSIYMLCYTWHYNFILAYFVLFRNADNCIAEQPEAEVSVKY